MPYNLHYSKSIVAVVKIKWCHVKKDSLLRDVEQYIQINSPALYFSALVTKL